MPVLDELRAAFAYSYGMTRKHWRAFILPAIVYGICMFLPDIISAVTDRKGDLYFLIAVTAAFLSMTFTIGLARMAFLLERGERASFWTMFAYGRYILPLLGTNLIFGLPVLFLGLLELRFLPYAILPTALAVGYFLLRLSFFTYFLAAAEKPLGLWESLRLSYRATRGRSVFVFCLTVAEFALLILGVLVLGFGIIWAVPYTTFACTFAYRRLIQAPDLTSPLA